MSPFLRPLLGHPSPQKGQKLSTSMPAAALAVLRTLVMTRLGVITLLPQMTCRPFCGPYILPSAKHPALRSTRDYRPRSFVASLADSGCVNFVSTEFSRERNALLKKGCLSAV
ncbi:MAG: hypothetical protein LEGION0398_MBIBDBAK_01011 [Legionellaceae bacterium]